MMTGESAIALIGNPGTGKSTILNGLVGSPQFSSGLSFGTGRTTRLQEYEHNGRFYYDTPGLDDIDKRKEAGAELDKLLQKKKKLKIAFVVMIVNGRVRSEDQATVRLVLDAIKSTNTDDKFGIIINQMPEPLKRALDENAFNEKNIRTSITNNRHTKHWCYVLTDKDMVCKENGLLMTSELEKFFQNLPDTKPTNAQVTKIDVDTWEEKLAEAEKQFKERERIMQQEIKTQEIKVKTLETLAHELKNVMQAERDANFQRQEEMKSRQNELQEMITRQQDEIYLAQEQARDVRGDLETYRQIAQQNEEKAKQELELAQQMVALEKARGQDEIECLQDRIEELERKKKNICTIM